jgi:hypothetical protein
VLCAFVPRESGARGLILASLVLDVIAIPTGIYLALFNLPRPELLVLGLSLIAWMLFVLFLRRLAAYLDQKGSAHEAAGILVGGLLLMVAGPLLGALLILLAVVSPVWAPLCFLAGLPLAIGWFVLLVRLFFQLLSLLQVLREAIRRGLTPG